MVFAPGVAMRTRMPNLAVFLSMSMPETDEAAAVQQTRAMTVVYCLHSSLQWTVEQNRHLGGEHDGFAVEGASKAVAVCRWCPESPVEAVAGTVGLLA